MVQAPDQKGPQFVVQARVDEPRFSFRILLIRGPRSHRYCSRITGLVGEENRPTNLQIALVRKQS
jgi:hypothetical protein